MRKFFIAVLLVLSIWQLASGTYIYGKAFTAQWLIEHAWHKTLQGERAVKPWEWADTWPVARLIVPEHEVDLFVLQGSSGRTLAFGPGHMVNTPLPGEQGNSVIGGHRDTHFRFLQDVKLGERFFVEKPDGRRIEYQVFNRSIVDHRDTDDVLNQDQNELTLVTCYPFDAVVAGGPLRFVIEARPV